jgi:hypothetical protein
LFVNEENVHMAQIISWKNKTLTMRKRFPEWVRCQVAWILRGQTLILYWMQENQTQRRISFVLGCLRMILWKIAIAISIKPFVSRLNIEHYFRKEKIESDNEG